MKSQNTSRSVQCVVEIGWARAQINACARSTSSQSRQQTPLLPGIHLPNPPNHHSKKEFRQMAEPPAKRARRTDSAAMWDRTSKSSDTRDKPQDPPRGEKRRGDRSRERRDHRDRRSGRDEPSRPSRSYSRDRIPDRDRERRRERSRSRDQGASRHVNGDRSRSKDRDGKRRRDRERRDRERSVSRERQRSKRGESRNL